MCDNSRGMRAHAMMHLQWRRGGDEELSVLWQRGFGDDPEWIDRFFRCLPQTRSAVLLQDGQAISMALAMDGMTLIRPGHAALPLVYAYCVTTLPEHRGQGCSRRIMRALHEDAKQRGALLCWRPATAALADWYAAILPVQSGFPLSTRTEQARPDANCAAVTLHPAAPTDYAAAREVLLTSQAHAAFSPALLTLQAENSAASGGGLWLLQSPTGHGCAITECGEDGVLYVKELLSDTLSYTDAAQALLHAHSAHTAHIRFPSCNDDAAQPAVQIASETPAEGIDNAWFGLFFD